MSLLENELLSLSTNNYSNANVVSSFSNVFIVPITCNKYLEISYKAEAEAQEAL